MTLSSHPGNGKMHACAHTSGHTCTRARVHTSQSPGSKVPHGLLQPQGISEMQTPSQRRPEESNARKGRDTPCSKPSLRVRTPAPCSRSYSRRAQCWFKEQEIPWTMEYFSAIKTEDVSSPGDGRGLTVVTGREALERPFQQRQSTGGACIGGQAGC